MPIKHVLSVILVILSTGCASGSPGTAYPGAGLVVYTGETPANAQAISLEAETFLEELGDYLHLRVPPANLLRIYHYPNRWRLWWHLSGAVPSLRWKRGACYETEEAYVVTLSGNPENSGFQTTLRHELTHYLIAVHFSNIPPWIDEGLAQVMASGPPFPHLDEDRLERVAGEARRCGEYRCLRLLRIPPGKKLSPSQYRTACALTWCLLSRSPGPPPRMLLQFLKATRPDIPPEQTFAESWGTSMEEACEAMVAWARPGARGHGSRSSVETSSPSKGTH